MAGKRSKHLFIFGAGFSARALASIALEHNWRVSGTSRSRQKLNVLSCHTIQPFLFPLDSPGSQFQLPHDVTHVLVSIPPGEQGDPVLPVMQALPRANRNAIEWLGYLSTTGVYGNWDGNWVDESSACHPRLARAQRRLETEKAWFASDLPVHIFRLAGIYGPGRNSIESLLGGTARRIDKPGQVFCRIHTTDIARGVFASMLHPAATSSQGIIFNMADDEPAPNHQVVAYAAELLGKPVPPLIPFEQAKLSSMARSFYSDCRRVKAEKIKQFYGLDWSYPSYREGLHHCLQTLNSSCSK